MLADFRPNLGALRHHARAYAAQRTATVFLNTAAFTANAGGTAILPKTTHGDPVSLVQLMRRPVERKTTYESLESQSQLAAVTRLGVTFCAGVRGGPPSGVVTFLFTDIEGSARRWETDADAMRAALITHDEVLRTAIEARVEWTRILGTCVRRARA